MNADPALEAMAHYLERAADPFLLHLKRCKERVAAWPDWKKAAVGYVDEEPAA